MKTDSFSRCHPLVNVLYFALVLAFAMFCMHPVSLALSLGSGLAYALSLKGWRGLRPTLGVLLPMAAMAAVINPIFNREGDTVLTRLPTGAPLTLESLAYGLAAAGMLAGVILWFSCFSAVMTSDKIIYLFGRAAPALSLILSMTLGFIPRFGARFRGVCEAQRCVGRDISEGPLIRRMRIAAAVLSTLITWSLEHAVETADSMKSRGYGLPGRTAFSPYRFDARDAGVLIWLSLWGGYMLAGALMGGLEWQYSPVIRGELTGGYTLSLHLAHLALCLTPLLLNGREDRKWKHIKSNS